MTQRLFWDLGKKTEEEMDILLNKPMYTRHDLYEAFTAGVNTANGIKMKDRITRVMFNDWIKNTKL